MIIEAMKQALEALEDATKHIFLGDKNGVEANIRAHKQCESLRQAIAEAEKQEPIGKAYLCDKCHTPFDDKWECPSCGHNSATQEDVYFYPQQRTWIDLTDDEMLMIYGQQHEGKKYSLGRMVQQALKEKNI